MTPDGEIITWGDNSAEQLNVPAGLPRVHRIAAGRFHTLALVDPQQEIKRPIIQEHPSTATVREMERAELSVLAIGLELRYQWLFNGAPLAQATNRTLVFPEVQVTQQGTYSVIVSNSAGAVTSQAALLTVEPVPVPVILQHPANVQTTSGGSATFSVTATGRAFHYQWEFNGVPLANATNRDLSLQGVQQSQQGAYRVALTNIYGSIRSDVAWLVVSPWPAPTIAEGADKQDVLAGETLTLRVPPAGTMGYSYQWRFGTTELLNATNETLVLAGLTASQAGDYTVRITSSSGIGISEPLTIRVVPGPDRILRSPDAELLQSMLRIGGAWKLEFDGVLVLQNPLVVTKSTALDAYGHKVTLSGNNLTRVFEMRGSTNLELANLEIRDGFATNGAGIYSPSGAITCSNVTFVGNDALGTQGLDGNGLASPAPSTGGTGLGGAIFAGGPVSLTGCRFIGNSATGGDGGTNSSPQLPGAGGGIGRGGALYALGATVITNCNFLTNTAVGGDGGRGVGAVAAAGSAAGGAVFCDGGSLVLQDSLLSGNSAVSGFGPSRNHTAYTSAYGGGLCNLSGQLIVVGCTIISNSVMGEAAGGGIYHGTGPLSISRSALVGNLAKSTRQTGTYQSQGWPGRGGGLFNGGVGSVQFCTFSSNQAIGGNGESGTGAFAPERGGHALGGGICNVFELRLVGCSIFDNEAIGGRGVMQGPGGHGIGGGICNGVPEAHVSMLNCTVTGNRAVGQTNGWYSWNGWNYKSHGYGGGLFSTNATFVALTNCTFISNHAVGGAAEPDATTNAIGESRGGNLSVLGESLLINNIVAAGSSNNFYGVFNDLGHNLSSDFSGTLTGPGSMNDTDPMLSPLGDYGGPTFTMVPLPGSPVINAGMTLPDVSVDQRGVGRPLGAAPDIGAIEAGDALPGTPFELRQVALSQGKAIISGVGPANRPFRLCTSQDLVHWQEIRATTTGPDGAFYLEEPFAADVSQRFFRIVVP